jgi:hypothetical protein
MTEAEWRTCASPTAMLEFLEDRASGRKLRLFAAACCRRWWRWLERPESRRAVEAAERFADALVPKAKLRAAERAADTAQAEVCEERDLEDTPLGASSPAAVKAACMAAFAAQEDAEAAAAWAVVLARKKEREAQVVLLHDLFGNPFRSAPLDPGWLSWNGGAVARLARAAYDERDLPAGTLDNGQLQVLADALEEAGCLDAEILGHLRGPGPHVRGCWVVDAVRSVD